MGKWQISPPQKAKIKLSMVDYVRNPTPHDNFGGGSATLWVVWANNVTCFLSKLNTAHQSVQGCYFAQLFI